MKPICIPFSGEIKGRTAVIIPIPMNETEATASTTSAATKFAPPRLSEKKPAITAKRTAVRRTP